MATTTPPVAITFRGDGTVNLYPTRDVKWRIEDVYAMPFVAARLLVAESTSTRWEGNVIYRNQLWNMEFPAWPVSWPLWHSISAEYPDDALVEVMSRSDMTCRPKVIRIEIGQDSVQTLFTVTCVGPMSYEIGFPILPPVGS